MKKRLHRSQILRVYKPYLVMLTGLIMLFSQAAIAADSFVPGSGGTLPVFPVFKPLAGTFPGFLVNSSDRYADWFNITRNEVEMSFPNASSLGAESLTLQYKNDNGDWTNFVYNDEVLTTTGNNFSLYLDRAYQLRLLVNGGPKNGFVSNEQFATLSNVNTYIGSWGIDESMYISNVMSPWAGCGIKTTVVNKTLSEGTVVEGGMTCQWYRVNPATYEATLIPGEDSLTYITKEADAGYRLMMQATGDGVKVGGFIKLMNSQPIAIANKCYINGISSTGFNLNLYKSAASLDTSDLTLYDKNYSPVAITSIEKTQNGAVYRINVPMPMDSSQYTLTSRSGAWKICSVFQSPFGEHLMEMVSFYASNASSLDIAGVNDIKAIYDRGSQTIRYVSDSELRSVQIYSMTGALLHQQTLGQTSGEISAEGLADGLYLLRFATSQGVKVAKVRVLKQR